MFSCNFFKMWQIFFLIQVYGFLIYQSDCVKYSPFGEPWGPMGPTIIEKPNNVDDDAALVDTAISQGQFYRLAALVGDRTLAQRLAIDQAYQKRKHVDVGKAIGYRLPTVRSGFTVDLYQTLFRPLPEYLAGFILFSLKQDDSRLYMSIICTSSATKLKLINEAYPKINSGKQLVDDLKSYKGRHTTVMRQMLDPKFMRPDNGSDPSKVEEQMKYIPGHGDKCHGNEQLSNFMTSASFEQIKLVANAWSNKNGNKSVVDTFRENCRKGLRQECYKRIVRYAVDPYQYFAEEFHLSLDKDSAVSSLNMDASTYLIVTRNEVDLKDVIASYNSQYKLDMIKEAKGWGPDRYTELILAVLVGNTGK